MNYTTWLMNCESTTIRTWLTRLELVMIEQFHRESFVITKLNFSYTEFLDGLMLNGSTLSNIQINHSVTT